MNLSKMLTLQLFPSSGDKMFRARLVGRVLNSKLNKFRNRLRKSSNKGEQFVSDMLLSIMAEYSPVISEDFCLIKTSL